MSDRFTISPNVIEWITRKIDLSTLPKAEQDLFFEWKKMDTVSLTYAEIESFSKKTKIPIGYFFMTKPPEENIEDIDHRTLSSRPFKNPSREFIDTYQSMKSIQNWTADYLQEQNVDDIDFIGAYQHASKSKIASEIRLLIGIDEFSYLKENDEKVYNDLKKHLSTNGIIIMQNGVVGSNNRRKLDLDEFRGFALYDQKAPLIFINNNDSTAGKVFTLLHETVHLLVGPSSKDENNIQNGNQVSKQEQIANAVAAEVILPDEIFQEEWKKLSQIEDNHRRVQKLAEKLHCSETLIGRKALDHHFINKDCYLKISQIVSRNFLSSRKSKRQTGGDYFNTMVSRLDPHFLALLDDGVRSGNTSYLEAYRLTGTTSKTYPKIIERAIREII